MFINVQTAQSIIALITFLVAYCVSVTCAGFFKAFVALKMGDDTPAEYGYLTLNPMAHIDLLGTFFLLVYKFGWSNFIPINPDNIRGSFRGIKIVITYLSNSIAHFCLAVISLIALLFLFADKGILDNLLKYLLTPHALAQAYPQASSYIFSIGLILISLLIVNMILAVISFFVDMCGLIIRIILERNPHYAAYSSFIMIAVPLALYFLLGPTLIIMTFVLIQKIGYFLVAFLPFF